PSTATVPDTPQPADTASRARARGRHPSAPPHPTRDAPTRAAPARPRLWAFRYSSARESRSLFYSSRVEALRRLHPDVAFLRGLSEDSRLVVSEPLGDLPGAWNEVPENSYGVVQPGTDELHRFTPAPP
ncbi:hypothetical protein ACFWIN_36085, partial [Streptomyces sp. NPDC127049]